MFCNFCQVKTLAFNLVQLFEDVPQEKGQNALA